MSGDLSGLPDGRETIRSMGWESLPYGCAGLLRKSDVNGSTVWSWLIVIPWASDAKPWIDGTKVYSGISKPEADQRTEILATMREILDQRYGDSVGNSAIDDLIRRFQQEGP